MKFKNLKERMEYYMNNNDYRLTPNSYVIAHIDGRAFSKLVKKRFELPFDDRFISMMNKTAKYICENVQGCKVAYVQSDEINIIITDFDTINTDSFFDYRVSKLCSIIGSLATARFNQLMFEQLADTPCSNEDLKQMIHDQKLAEFGVKICNVPLYNDTFAWLKYRQNDCIRNSINQSAQTYLPHKELEGKKTEETVAYLKEKKGIDWNDYSDGKKYGRIIHKCVISYDTYTRNEWRVFDAPRFTREWYDEQDFVPQEVKEDE